MANKQISDLQARTFDGDSIIAHDVENTDPSTMSQKPYLTGSATGHAVADFIANGEEFTTDLDTTDKHLTGAINELNTDKQDKLSNSDIPITALSQSVSDVTLKCTRYGNVACITGYFRTTASISANSSIFSGFPNPVVPSGDSNMYFIFLNETDNTLMRFRINRNYCELKNPVALASGKTFVGSVTYICD